MVDCRKTLLLFNWLEPLTEIMKQQGIPYITKGSKEALLQRVLYAPPPVLLEFVNAIADDVGTWSKLGLLGKKTGEQAGRVADWCWFMSTWVGLAKNGLERQVVQKEKEQGKIGQGLGERARLNCVIIVEERLYRESVSKAGTRTKEDEKELEQLEEDEYWLGMTRAKLVMDLIFVCE